MGYQKGDKAEKSNLRLQIEGYEPHPDVDYEIFSTINPERIYTDVNTDMSARGQYRNRTSYQRFADFTKWLESRGGVQQFLHATQREILAPLPGEPPSMGLYATDLEGRRKPFDQVQKAHSANRFMKYIQFAARLETIRAHEGNAHPYDFIVNLVATGYTYSEIAHGFGLELTGFVDFVTQNVDPGRLKAAWATRTQLMLDATDKLFEEAITGDFTSECGREVAESKAKVLSATAGHLKLQAVSRHVDYSPQKSSVVVTPGSITISLAAPE